MVGKIHSRDIGSITRAAQNVLLAIGATQGSWRVDFHETVDMKQGGGKAFRAYRHLVTAAEHREARDRAFDLWRAAVNPAA